MPDYDPDLRHDLARELAYDDNRKEVNQMAIEDNTGELIPVQSSHVDGYLYGPDGGLIVQFKNGRKYRYDAVPQGIADELARVASEGESFGKALNMLVKNGGFAGVEMTS